MEGTDWGPSLEGGAGRLGRMGSPMGMIEGQGESV